MKEYKEPKQGGRKIDKLVEKLKKDEKDRQIKLLPEITRYNEGVLWEH